MTDWRERLAGMALPASSTIHVFQDPDGMVWISTMPEVPVRAGTRRLAIVKTDRGRQVIETQVLPVMD